MTQPFSPHRQNIRGRAKQFCQFNTNTSKIAGSANPSLEYGIRPDYLKVLPSSTPEELAISILNELIAKLESALTHQLASLRMADLLDLSQVLGELQGVVALFLPITTSRRQRFFRLEQLALSFRQTVEVLCRRSYEHATLLEIIAGPEVARLATPDFSLSDIRRCLSQMQRLAQDFVTLPHNMEDLVPCLLHSRTTSLLKGIVVTHTDAFQVLSLRLLAEYHRSPGVLRVRARFVFAADASSNPCGTAGRAKLSQHAASKPFDFPPVQLISD